mgnify:CR=1 FL=1
MGNIDGEVGRTERHFAIITRVADETLKAGLRGAVFFKSDTLTGGSEYPEPAEPSFPLAGKGGEGFFWVPQVGDQIEIEINAEDENANPKYIRMLYSDEDEIADVFKENYPYRMGWATRAGHIFYFDNKAEALAVRLMHKLGTGFEWDKDGNEIKKVVKNLIETIGGDIKREIKGQVEELFKAEVKRIYDGKVTETFKKDLTQKVQGSYSIEGKTASVKGKTKTEIGSSSSPTEIQGQIVNLAGGGAPVAKVGSQAIGVGNLGAPVVSTIIDGSVKVTTA